MEGRDAAIPAWPESRPAEAPEGLDSVPYSLALRRAATARRTAVRVLRDDRALWCVVSEQPMRAPVGRWELLVDTVDGMFRATSYPPHWMLLSEGELREVVRDMVRLAKAPSGFSR